MFLLNFVNKNLIQIGCVLFSCYNLFQHFPIAKRNSDFCGKCTALKQMLYVLIYFPTWISVTLKKKTKQKILLTQKCSAHLSGLINCL